MKKKSFLLNASVKLFDDLDQYVDGIKYTSRTHIITSILKEWLDKEWILKSKIHHLRDLKPIKKTER